MTYNEPWFTTTRNFWVGPGDQIWPDQKIKYVRHLLDFEGARSYLATFLLFYLYQIITTVILFPRFKLKAVYMYVAGFYTYSIFALLFWETRRSDFGISMTSCSNRLSDSTVLHIQVHWLSGFFYLSLNSSQVAFSFFSTHIQTLTVCEYFFILAVAF